ncbi:uncharacterized protein LOC127751074 [Frankliniella occidentalis]|uniref:Uncharacterized protein LOC127751074 n=1 Tax=Frankliniella occidentalis TaxID=133901 RepID=A0A9C6X6G1_FRAOC|nr:uncharacterized protein LOC127751074 [Frankliniella occidentalis]
MTCTAMAHVLATFCIVSATAKSIPSFAGPYIPVVQKIYMCGKNPSENPALFFLKVSHFNPVKPHEKQNITGNITLPFGADDSYWVQTRVDKWSGNQWKENFFVFRFPGGICTSGRANAPDVFRVLFNHTITSGPCFIKPGLYSVNNEPISWRLPNIPALPYGSYRIWCKMGQISQETVSCQLCLEVSANPEMTL